ncbi:MAG: NlpC/P60 family protein [Actinomycetota bacterium]|nr:NlpC/P60 family protein [Actinomycetota bacterium]
MRPAIRRRVGALLVLALLVSLVAPLGPASADVISDKRVEAERIARQLEQQSRQVSILAEDYDEARVRIVALESELAVAQDKVTKTDARAGAIRIRLKEQAVASYIRGGSMPALAMLAGTRSTQDLAVRSQYVRTVTSGAVDVLDDLRAVRLQLDEQRGRLDDAKSEAKSAADLAETKRQQAAQAQAAQERTLQQVQGELATMVEAEAKRRAEEEARRVQAELAAKAVAKAKADAEAKAREAAARDAAAKQVAAEVARRAATTTTAAPKSAGPVVTVRPSTTTSPTTTTTVRPTTTTDPPPAGPPAAGAEAAIAEARRQLGKPYEYGGSGPSTFDCSGLTSWAWRAGGKRLSHSSRVQWTETSRVAIDAIQPGDLLFYGSPIHHVGLYIGDGQMIEAPETGKNVRLASIYRGGYVGAGRVN